MESSQSIQPKRTGTSRYSESSCQTNQQDPVGFIKNFELLKLASDFEQTISTDACGDSGQILENEVRTLATKYVHSRLECEDESDEDSSSFDQDQELHRRLNPTRPEDFETLQSELFLWRRREERKIAFTSRNEQHKQQLTKVLLNKEACLLRKIDSLKNAASKKCESAKMESLFLEFAQPKKWEVGNGLIIAVDTPDTCRARETKEMYDELRRKVDCSKLSRTFFPCSQLRVIFRHLSQDTQQL